MPPSEATLARIRAEDELERVKAQTPWWDDLAERLRYAREHNQIREAIEGSPGLRKRHP
jgi:hypothetical protein